MRIDTIRKRQGFRIALLTAGLCCTFFCMLILQAQMRIQHYSNRVYSDPDKLPDREYALLLGTARTVQGKFKNPYFQNRIDAAVRLYKAGKIKKIIVSGDNGRTDYNEPEDMKNELVRCGVRESDILQDFAGFRTLDSVVRARNVFHVQNAVVISQRFHCERALFLAAEHGMDEVIGFAAADVPGRFRVRTMFREPLARWKAWLDVRLLRTKPHFEK